jgi:hypothetical protein
MTRAVERARWLGIVMMVVGLCLCVSTAYAWDLPQSERIPFKVSESDDNALIYRAVLAFFVAGAAAYGLARCIKRFAPHIASRSIGVDRKLERLETLRLSARSVLYRVRIGDEELIIGESEHGVALLAKQSHHQASPKESINE